MVPQHVLSHWCRDVSVCMLGVSCMFTEYHSVHCQAQSVWACWEPVRPRCNINMPHRKSSCQLKLCFTVDGMTNLCVCFVRLIYKGCAKAVIYLHLATNGRPLSPTLSDRNVLFGYGFCHRMVSPYNVSNVTMFNIFKGIYLFVNRTDGRYTLWSVGSTNATVIQH